jgi:hypothetical protein
MVTAWKALKNYAVSNHHPRAYSEQRIWFVIDNQRSQVFGTTANAVLGAIQDELN